MTQYNDFIPENVATAGARRIGVYNEQGNRIGTIPLGSLAPPDTGKRLYSFGVLSDVHIGEETSSDDFAKALTYLSEETDFICIVGDLIHNNSTDQPTEYKRIVDAYAKVPVYACAGNHDAAYFYPIENNIETYTGKPLYYTVDYTKDLLVFAGVKGNNAGTLFTAAELDWLEETVEANKDRRIFLFQHVRPEDGCGNALGIYTNDIWGGEDQLRFEAILRQYPNIILFHGHSHLKFHLQQYSDIANIDHIFGCWSVHVPSIAVPRDTSSVVNPTRVDVYAESEGYVVDVHENGIHLRGRDFVKGEFLPIASYWLNTTTIKA